MQTQRVAQPDGDAEQSPGEHRIIIRSHTGLSGVISIDSLKSVTVAFDPFYQNSCRQRKIGTDESAYKEYNQGL